MPYTIAGRNLMLNALKGTAPATPITHIGLYDDDTAITDATGAASTDTFTRNAHGFSNGNLIFLSSKTGGAELIEARPYFVVSVTTNTFQVSNTFGGSAATFSTDITAVTVTRAVELSGGSYARVAIAYATAADGEMDDTTNGADVNVPSGATVNRVGYFSASTSGALLAVTTQTPEGPYGAAGIYRVTNSLLHLNASGAS